MKIQPLNTEDTLRQFLVVLDADIQGLEQNIATLDQLRRLVVKKDGDGLSQLLSLLQSQHQNYHDNELKRNRLRKKLAASYGCPVEQMTLSGLGAMLDKPTKRELTERKLKLRQLTIRLKKEHTSTQRLLKNCARFNRMLLKSIFDMARPGSTTYNAAGSTQRQMDNVFMNVQL